MWRTRVALQIQLASFARVPMIPTLHQLIKETLTLRTSDAEGGGRERGSAGAMVGILNGVVSHTCFGFLRCAFYMLDVKAFRHQALLENNTGLARPISTSEDTTAQIIQNVSNDHGEPCHIDGPSGLLTRLPNPTHGGDRGSVRPTQRGRAGASGRVPARMVRPASSGSSL